MHRQKYNVNKAPSSRESLENRRLAKLYCRKCCQVLKRSQALPAGRSRRRCPACGETLEPTLPRQEPHE